MEKSLCYNIKTLFKVYKQKVKHLLFEHQNNISDLKADNVCALKLAQEDHREEEKKLRKDKRGLKVTLKEEELSHEDIIKNLKKVRHKKNQICTTLLFLHSASFEKLFAVSRPTDEKKYTTWQLAIFSSMTCASSLLIFSKCNFCLMIVW